MKTEIMRARILIAVFCLVVAGIFISIDSARAINCDDTGTLPSLGLDPLELAPNKSITVRGTFQYKQPVTVALVECLDKEIVVEYSVLHPQLGAEDLFLSKTQTRPPFTGDPARVASFDALFTHAEVARSIGGLNAQSNRTVEILVRVRHPVGKGSDRLVEKRVPVSYIAKLDVAFACIGDDDKYKCDTVSDCSNVRGSCTKKPACIQLDDNRKCGQPAVTPAPSGSVGPNTPGPPGREVTFDFEIKNPLKINSFMEFITTITVWLTNIAIPIAVILIVYAGVLFLTAGAVPANVTRARTILTYVIIGLAVILIGRGFISLIESVLNLGDGTGTSMPSPSATPQPSSTTSGPLPSASSRP